MLRHVTPPSTFANSDTETGMTSAPVLASNSAVRGNASDAMMRLPITSTSPDHGSSTGTATSDDDGSGDTSIQSAFTRNRPSGSALHADLRCRHLITGT